MANALLGTFQANPEQLESFSLQRSRSSDEVEGLGISQGSDDAVVGNRGQIVEQGPEAVHTLARGGAFASGFVLGRWLRGIRAAGGEWNAAEGKEARSARRRRKPESKLSASAVTAGRKGVDQGENC